VKMQGGIVLDASAAVTWVLRDGAPQDEAGIDEILSTGFILVPELWHAEVANAFRAALRAGRIDEALVVGGTRSHRVRHRLSPARTGSWLALGNARSDVGEGGGRCCGGTGTVNAHR
jgi:hypothetical protein